MKKGLLIIFAGPSGVGKGTILKELLEDKNLNLAYSISMTTRAPRKGEIEGESYFFVTKEDFEKAIENDEFLEYAKYVDNYYGTPKAYVEKQRNEGKNVILEIEIEGASNIKKLLPESIFIFIMPPSIKTLVKRLKKPNTDSNDKLMERFHKTYKEINEVTKYNYVVINDDLEETVDKVVDLINHRPRKCLGWKTPAEVFEAECVALA